VVGWRYRRRHHHHRRNAPDASSNSLRERFFYELALESWYCLKSKVRSVNTE